MSALVVSFAEANREWLLEAILPDIHDAVSSACHHYSVSQSEIDDFYHQVILLLMEDDYRRLRSFARSSSLKTWLTAIAMHCVSNYLRSQKRAMSLGEIPSYGIILQPTQVDRFNRSGETKRVARRHSQADRSRAAAFSPVVSR